MIVQEKIPSLLNKAVGDVRLHLSNPNTYFGEPNTSPITADIQAQCQEAEFREEFFYINNTYREVTMMKRDGLTMSIGHTNSRTSKDFVVRRAIRLKRAALLSTLATLANFTSTDNAELAEIKKCLSHVDTGRFSEASLMLDYVISVDELNAHGGTVYHQQCDVVLSLKDAFNIDPHPYSSRFLNIGNFGNTKDYAYQKELNIKIRLVDHSSAAGPRYLALGNKTFKIMPQKDAPYRRISTTVAGKTVERDSANYVEVFYSACSDTALIDNKGVGWLKLSLADAKDELGLYDSLADAANPSRLEGERKRELTSLQHALEVLRGQNSRDKARQEQEDLQRREALTASLHELEVAKLATVQQKQEIDTASNKLQLEIAQAKAAQAVLDSEFQRLDNERRTLDLQRKSQDDLLERERKEFESRAQRLRDENEARLRNEGLYWKDFYEMRAAQRKDTSDFVRFVPGLLLGVTGIAAAWLKFSTSAKAS